MADEKDNYVPSQPAGKDDEDVLAGIARRHAARMDSRQADTISVESPPLREPPVRKPIEVRPLDTARGASAGEYLVRRAVRKFPHRPAGRGPAWRLVVQIAVVAALTGLAVMLYLLWR